MKILVTGGAGYIGSHTVKHLLAQGERIVVLDNLVFGHKEALPKDVTFIKGDSVSQEVLGKIRTAVGDAPALVILDSLHTREHVLRELEAGNDVGVRFIVPEQGTRWHLK